MVTKVNGGSAPFNALAGNVKYYKVSLTTNTATGTADTVDFTLQTAYANRLDIELVYRVLAARGTVVALSVEDATKLHVMVENAGIVDDGVSDDYAEVEAEIKAALETNLFDSAGGVLSGARTIVAAVTGTTTFQAI